MSTTDRTTSHSDAVTAVAAWGLPGSQLALPAHPLDDGTAASLASSAHSQRLSGLLVSAMDSGEIALPATAEDAVRRHHVTEMSGVLTLERALLRAHDVLDSVGVGPLALKGSAVAHLDYADASLRSFGDVDLLIKPDEFDRAIAALTAAGYRRRVPEPSPGFDRRFGKGATLLSADGVELDVHRTFAMGPFGLTIDLDELWSDTESFHVGGQTLRALGPERRLLHTAYHAVLGNWPPRLVPMRDLAEMLLYGSADTRQVIALATRWRGEAVLATAVRRLWGLFRLADVTVTSDWAHRHRPDATQARHLLLYTEGDRSYSAKSMAALSLLPSWRDRLAFTRAMLLPRPGFGPGGRTAAWRRVAQARLGRAPGGLGRA